MAGEGKARLEKRRLNTDRYQVAAEDGEFGGAATAAYCMARLEGNSSVRNAQESTLAG